MTLPSFRINQPGGGGTGTLDTARPYGLRQGVAVNLVTTETGPYLWEIVAAPPGSAAALSNAEEATASITPDVTNLPWRIRLTTGTGISAKTRIFVMGADLNSSGASVGDGFMPPAYGEKEGEDNSTDRGYAARVETILETLRVLAGSGGSGSTNIIIYDEGAVSPSEPTYATFGDAHAAAASIVTSTGGPVDLVIVRNNDPPAVPAGTWSMARRIRVRMVAPTDLPLPQALQIDSGAIFEDPIYFEGIDFSGNLSTPLFVSSTTVPLDITFCRCTHDGTGDTSDMAQLKTGTSRFVFQDQCDFSLDTTHFATLEASKNVYVRAEGESLLNAEAFGGTAGTLSSYEGAGSVIEAQASFSGTHNAENVVVDSLSRATYPIGVNGQRISSVADPSADADADNQGSRDQAIEDAALRVFRYAGVAGSVDNDTTGWVTIGSVTVDPSLLRDAPGLTRAYTLRGDLQIVEASPGTVTAEVRLLDSSLTSLGTAASTLSGATTFPEHAFVALTAGNSNGQLRPAVTTYLVQLRRQGGSAGDRAICHNAHVEVRWS